ncbi:MAG: endonuclease/exonuclease/phosphatase family protein [Polyangia bacterium]|jgi:endonuclease/exonuclease/phosphatase family metal-dependent hydrolase|nr:endonuclease/exonuclease/phosphatase family protein [Polyangia bacterium]
MRTHTEPDFDYAPDIEAEKRRIAEHREKRWIPARSEENLLLATWNLTALGEHDRSLGHLELMAEILQPFDLVAVQEVGEDLTHLEVLLGKLQGNWHSLYSAVEGDGERLGFIYNADRVTPDGLAGDLRVQTTAKRTLSVGGVSEEFEELHRDPYLAHFVAGELELTLCNVHLYRTSSGLRNREALALARWAAGRVEAAHPPCGDVVVLGDFNLSRLYPGDALHTEFLELGMMVPGHGSHVVRTNYAKDRHYDALAFFPARTAEGFAGTLGVFDFDNVVFPNLYEADPVRFHKTMRYCLSDHRPLWIEIPRARR